MMTTEVKVKVWIQMLSHNAAAILWEKTFLAAGTWKLQQHLSWQLAVLLDPIPLFCPFAPTAHLETLFSVAAWLVCSPANLPNPESSSLSVLRPKAVLRLGRDTLASMILLRHIVQAREGGISEEATHTSTSIGLLCCPAKH